MRLLAIWGLGGGGGDLARTTFPRLLPLETVRRPGEARALVYPLAAGERGEIEAYMKRIKETEQVKRDSGLRCILGQLEVILKIILQRFLF